jgi:hypothetical protein
MILDLQKRCERSTDLCFELSNNREDIFHVHFQYSSTLD